MIKIILIDYFLSDTHTKIVGVVLSLCKYLDILGFLIVYNNVKVNTNVTVSSRLGSCPKGTMTLGQS